MSHNVEELMEQIIEDARLHLRAGWTGTDPDHAAANKSRECLKDALTELCQENSELKARVGEFKEFLEGYVHQYPMGESRMKARDLLDRLEKSRNGY